MLINHVLSNDTHSAIFSAIFEYFVRYAPPGVNIEVTVDPLADADVHHYHRPHLEGRLTRRSVVTVHHDLCDPDPWLDFGKFQPRYEEARRVVCLNHGQRQFLAERSIDRTVVIPHGYNERVLRPKPSRAEHVASPRVTLGLFSKYYDRRFKGEAYLHDLVKRLSPDAFSFVLVGERRQVTARYLCSLGFPVRLFEYLPYRLFQSLYESVDYLLMCSNFEGGPANLPEAMATCTPIVATPVGFAPDFIRHEENGVLLSGDPDEDARRLNRLVDPCSPLVQRIRTGCEQLQQEIPTWAEVIDRYFQVYHDVADVEGG